MPFPFTCPSCRSTSQALDQLAGTRAKCPTCGDVVSIPPMGRPVDAIQVVRPIEGIPTIPPLIEQPAPPVSGRGSGALIALMLGGLLLLTCCGGGGVFGLIVALRDPRPNKPETKLEVARTSASRPAPAAPAVAAEKPRDKELLRSTAWLITGDGRRSGIGTATVVHREQRLLLTNYHIVRSSPSVIVIFPLWKPDGEPVTRANPYFDAAEKKGLKARVVASDAARDLALLQVDELPADVKPMLLAAQGPGGGQRVSSIAAADRPVGFGEEDGALWRVETMTVKRALSYQHRYNDGQRVSAQVIEMSIAGEDSGFGGPVIDEQGQLVGVICDFCKRTVRNAIDVREARAVLADYFTRIGLRWSDGAPPSAAAPLDVTNNSPSYWLQIVAEGNESRAEKARERLVAMGRAAILELRKALRDKDQRLRLAAVSVLGDMGETATGAVADLVKALTDPDTAIRAAVARTLGRLGATGHPALPALVIASGDAPLAVSEAAAAALPKIGPIAADDVPKLLPLWAEKDLAKRGRHLALLLGLKPAPDVAGPLFAPLLADFDKKIRLQVIRALEEAGPRTHAAAFAPMLRCAGDRDADIRKAALAALAKLGPGVAADRSNLESGLRSEGAEVRILCLDRLGDLGAAAGPSAPDIARLLRDLDTGVKVAAARALGRIGKPAAIVLPDVLVAAHDIDVKVRAAASEAIGKLSREPRTVAMLFDALADDARDVREAAGRALRSLDPPLNRDDVAALRSALRSKAVESRRVAAAELARLGADASAAAQEMLAATHDPDYEVRRYAFAILPALGEKGKELLPFVLETMSTILQEDGRQPGSLELFRQASVTFAKLGDPLDALPIWSKGLRTRDRTLRKEVVQSLATVGPPARKVAGDLCALLDEPDFSGAVGDTLLALRGEEVVRALSDMLEDNPSATAKMAAIQILGKMGPDAKDAFQALYKTSQRYAGKELGQAAKEALKQIQKKS